MVERQPSILEVIEKRKFSHLKLQKIPDKTTYLKGEDFLNDGSGIRCI